MAVVIKPPALFDEDLLRYSIFLGGAIDQNKARDWQTEVSDALSEFDITILNPRRDDWDESWETCADREPFRSQECDMCLYVYTKDSKAPITMFENGAWGTRKDCLVCVEEGFYRQGNLDIYMNHFQIPIYHNLDEMLVDLKAVLEKHVGRR